MTATQGIHNVLESVGYAIAEEIMGPRDLERIRDWIGALVSRGTRVPFSLEPEFEQPAQAQALLVRKIRRLFWHDPEFWADIFTSSRIRDLAGHILGPEATLILHAAFLKPAHFGSATPPHQDQALWGIDYPRAVSVWVAIDPATRENGCLQLYPGSHLLGELPHPAAAGGHPRVDVSRVPIDARETPLRPGDAAVWHRYMLHASEPNRSARNRWGMVMVFADGAAPGFDAYDRFPLRLLAHRGAAAAPPGARHD